MIIKYIELPEGYEGVAGVKIDDTYYINTGFKGDIKDVRGVPLEMEKE